jgi:hypothetical protein
LSEVDILILPDSKCEECLWSERKLVAQFFGAVELGSRSLAMWQFTCGKQSILNLAVGIERGNTFAERTLLRVRHWSFEAPECVNLNHLQRDNAFDERLVDAIPRVACIAYFRKPTSLCVTQRAGFWGGSYCFFECNVEFSV